jgi:hypothetical protein
MVEARGKKSELKHGIPVAMCTPPHASEEWLQCAFV